MDEGKHRVCPVAISGSLDNRFRRWLQNPRKILDPYIEEGMTVLDFGCGPGFFTIDIAQMVGKTGRVIASDLQEGMLQKLRNKIRGTELEERITLHKCQESRIGLSEKVDFVLAFYMVHEISDREAFFQEIAAILKPNGQALIVEPPFHVSKRAFQETIRTARRAGLSPAESPKMLFNKAVVLRKG
jgi:ubiquinone/menaquinone biosynthesis C-methylase UbiE